MRELDYIVVGLGISGLAFCEQLRRHKKRFIVFDRGDYGATTVAGGVLNPVVLKRFTLAWDGIRQLETANQFYTDLSNRLDVSLITKIPVLRIFNSIEEQNNWGVAGDKKELRSFLSSEILQNTNPAIKAPFGFGKVNNTKRIGTSLLLEAYSKELQENSQLVSEAFDYCQLQQEVTKVCYKNVTAKKIVFSEGTAVINNPFFPKECIIGNKGEYLILKAPDLKLKEILKGYMFIIPLGNDLYKVGATYSLDDCTKHTTQEAKAQIIDKFSKICNCEFKVVDQISGIRPTTKDRRPLLGILPKNPSLVFLNGMGTHGLMAATTVSKTLYDYLEKGVLLPKEMDINRFFIKK